MAVQFPGRAGIFLFSTVQCSTEALSLGVKRPESKADHLPPSSADVKNALSPHIFRVWYLKNAQI
jgi:hypothetical protein